MQPRLSAWIVYGANMKKDTKKPKEVLTYKCQFCEEESPAKNWKDDKCPLCKRSYDPMLAQEGDD